MKAHRAIFTDQLTGTYNQDFFFESAEQIVQLAIRNKVPLSICVIEIDDFALLKEKYGDMVSRRLVKRIADTIVYKCRKSG
jgi:diguanylate cyclase (GGDEF)-like protein